MLKIGIIGGSGLDNPNLLSDYKEISVETPYGNPSSKITSGKIHDIEVFVLARHGKNHEINPTNVNYKANIYALNSLGCTHIIATSAVGSLKPEIKPGEIVIPNQLIDFTKLRKNTYNDIEGNVIHTPFSEPFSKFLREVYIETAKKENMKIHETSTLVVIEGPRFSTYAESLFFSRFADIIGMTTFPECILARELEIEYASIAMATDYDCWKKDEEPVTFEIVKQRMKENAEKVKNLIIKIIESLSILEKNEKDIELIKSSIRTIPDFPKKGIMFRDITTLLQNPEAFEKTMNIFEKRYKEKNIDIIAGIESRGFIIASALASKLKKPLVLLRKPGKLPYEKISEQYNLEYGTDSIEVHKDAVNKGQNVLLIDDLLATGGTMSAACNLIKKINANVIECAFVIELPELKGKEKISSQIFSIVKFNGE